MLSLVLSQNGTAMKAGPQGGLNQPHANKMGEGKENLLYDFVSFCECFEQGL